VADDPSIERTPVSLYALNHPRINPVVPNTLKSVTPENSINFIGPSLALHYNKVKMNQYGVGILLRLFDNGMAGRGLGAAGT
jgi:hypothetical protein